jgi:hypothetical protein
MATDQAMLELWMALSTYPDERNLRIRPGTPGLARPLAP